MNSLFLALLSTGAFFGGVALLVGWGFLAAKIENTVVAMSVLLAPFVVVVFVLSYIFAEAA